MMFGKQKFFVRPITKRGSSPPININHVVVCLTEDFEVGELVPASSLVQAINKRIVGNVQSNAVHLKTINRVISHKSETESAYVNIVSCPLRQNATNVFKYPSKDFLFIDVLHPDAREGYDKARAAIKDINRRNRIEHIKSKMPAWLPTWLVTHITKFIWAVLALVVGTMILHWLGVD
jgi:hypothetical protein